MSYLSRDDEGFTADILLDFAIDVLLSDLSVFTYEV